MTASWSRRAVLALACAGATALLAACGSGSVVSDLTPKRFISVGDGFADVGQNGHRFTVNDGSLNWLQQFAAHYKLTLEPATADGFGYAQGHARIDNPDTRSGTNAPSVQQQIDTLLARTSLINGDVVFVGGGIGMAPLRTLFLYMLDNRADFGKIRLLYGARSPLDMAFSAELPEWTSRTDIETTLTIDREADGWEHKVGLIPNVLLEMAPKAENCVAITCGPPIMIKFTLEALKKLEFPDEQILTTLEKRMKCGVGICGRCNIGGRYVCVDGPVFTWQELQDLPPEL